MGTNYYAEIKSNPCPTCGHDPDSKTLHIGKSSCGWCFSLHVEPNNPNFPSNWDEWIELLSKPNVQIVDEYKEPWLLEDFIPIVTDRSWRAKRTVLPDRYHSWSDYYNQNHAVPGPNNLLRHRLGEHCIAHGKGTWDLIVGGFS